MAFPGFGGSRRASSRSACERLVARPGTELLDVDSRGYFVDALDVTNDLLEDPSDVLGADEDRRGPRERLPPPRLQLRVSAHRVLELGAVRLDRVARAARRADRATQQHVVGEDEVGREQLPHGRRVLLDVSLPLLARQLLEQARLVALVAVEHERRQRTDQLRAHGFGGTEVVLLGVRLLGDDDHVVPGVAPLARERARVDIRAGAPEQVAVPEHDSHGGTPGSLRSG